MPRYALLHHTGWEEDHYDWMMEIPGEKGLRTWRIPCPPQREAVVGRRIQDHRKRYLDYEGEIAGGRGRVRRIRGGTFEWIELREERIVVSLEGEILSIRRIPSGEWVFRLEASGGPAAGVGR